MKKSFALGAFALVLGGCAAGPYYGGGYGYGNGPGYYGYGPGYYGYGAPAYEGPSVSLGYYYFDNDGRRQWRDGRDGRDARDAREGDQRWRGRDWNNDRGDRRDGNDRRYGGVRDSTGAPVGGNPDPAH